jgi:DNA-binding MurR/RpiR family transcriptional regulator
MALFSDRVDWNSLSETEKIIYRYMQTNAEKLPFMRVRDIAQETYTSATSVMRLIRKLGYNSFNDFRYAVKEQAKDQGVDDIFAVLSPDIYPTTLQQDLQALGERVKEADNVIFLGIGNSGATAKYAARRFANIGVNSFPMTDFSYPIINKLKYSAVNIVVVLSVSGGTPEVIEVVNQLKAERDITTIGITANIKSPLANLCDHVLAYTLPQRRLVRRLDLSSQVPATFILESLAYYSE